MTTTMKRLLIAFSLLFAFSAPMLKADTKDKTNPSADRYNVTDSEGKLAFGKSYYEQDGRPSGANGNFYSTSNSSWSIKKWPDSNTKKHIATYLHFPKCSSNAKIQLTTTGSLKLTLVVTNMENGQEMARQNISIAKGAQQWVDVLDTTTFPQSGWYKFDLECTSGASSVGEFFFWQFGKTGSTEKIYTADYMSSPSVHLSAWKTTDPAAPSGGMYDWVYQEVMVPESSAVVGTYCMSLGVLHGYMGIQIDSDNDYPIIFSMWDNGSTDEDPNLPDYLRSGALDWETGVTIARFANEGTGAQAKYRTGRNWVPGKWVKFITNARPEIVNVEIDDPNNPGQKKTITYTNTLCSAWYMADGKDTDWHYIATIRQSGANNYFDGWYSFLENYNWPTGQWQRKAYYRNGGVHSLTNGKWYHANSVGFGHTDGGDKYGDRRDYGQGQTEDFDNCFFMSTGGYHEDPVQNSKVLPLIRNFNPVDQATIDRLSARVDQAIRREQILAMKENISNACEIYPQSTFKVIAKSDEATNEGTANVATAVFDGDENTYWHSKWSGGEAGYPHTLTIQVQNPENVRIGQLSLCQKRESRYRAKQLTVSTSSDNKTWTAVETVTLEDTNAPNVEFSSPISAPYIKLSFDKGYGTNLLCINEIYFKSAPSLDDLKKQAQDILAHANKFGGYSSEALTELISVYANGSVTNFNELSNALNALAANSQPLKFGRVDAMKNLSSFKAYQLHHINNKGELVATTTGEVKAISEEDLNVVDAHSNWLILNSDVTNKYYLYNLGAKKFLKVNGSTYTLTSDIQTATVSYTNGGFRFGNTDTWEVRDNYVAQPAHEVPAEVLARIENAVLAAERQAKVDKAQEFLAAAKADAAKDFDSKYIGIYDVTALEKVLAKTGATTEEIAEAYDKVRASALPKPGHYYRLANFARPTKSSKTNYLALAGAERDWKFITTNTSNLGPKGSTSTLAENFRIYSVVPADNDSTFYVYCPASRSFLMSQNADRGNTAVAAPIQISYNNNRLFRMKSGNKYLTISSSSNELTEYATREDAELFYFEEVTTLPAAVSTDETGLGSVCLPLPVVLPASVEAYIPTHIADGRLVIEPLNNYLSDECKDVLPAYLPVILRSVNGGEVNATECVITAQPDTEKALKANLFGGDTYRLVITKDDYVTSTTAANVMRRSTTTTLKSNTPYLPASQVPEEFSGNLDIVTTGIHEVVILNPDGSETILPTSSFDLMGRPSTKQNPVIIKNGVKILRK